MKQAMVQAEEAAAKISRKLEKLPSPPEKTERCGWSRGVWKEKGAENLPHGAHTRSPGKHVLSSAASWESQTPKEEKTRAPGCSSGEWNGRPICLSPTPRKRNLFPRRSWSETFRAAAAPDSSPPPTPPPARPPPAPPGRPEARGGRNKFKYTGIGGGGASGETREGAAGRPFPPLGPAAPCPATRVPLGKPPGRAGLAGGAAWRPGGAKGREEAWGGGAGRGRRGARRPGPSGHPPPPHTPTPARAGRAASPQSGPGWTPRPAAHCRRPWAPPRSPGPQPPPPRRRPLSPFHSLPGAWRGPANPRPHVSALAARPACAAQPAALREPGDVGRAWGRLCLPFSCFFFSFPPFPSAGLTDQSERRWQWTRKLGCRCYCSPLGSGESLSLSSKRAVPALATGSAFSL
nr:uncharacterized protein LOC116152954 [Camelus dromedarius]